MKKSFVVFFLVLVLLFSSFSFLSAEEETDYFSLALSAAGLSPEDVTWDMDKLDRLNHDPFRLNWFNEIWSKPLLIPQITRQMTDRISIWNSGDMGNELKINYFYGASKISGYVAGFFDQYLPAFEYDEELPFTNSLKEVFEYNNWGWTDRFEEKITNFENSVTPETAKLLAEFIFSSKHLQVERQRVFDGVTLNENLFQKLNNFFMEDDMVELYKIAEKADMKQLFWANCRVVFSVQNIKNAILDGTFDLTNINETFLTPYGRITLNGTKSNDEYLGENHMLIVDTIGDDTYFGNMGATNSLSNCISVIIDLAGDDHYEAESDSLPSFGGGVLGVGMVLDFEGSDTYSSFDNTQGSGIFGTGILADYGGNDKYNAVNLSQGAGIFGTGFCLDYSGDDEYYCYFGSQGFGYTQGYGLLYDKNGNDTYTANDEDIVNPSAQNSNHNTSMSQGCGFGRRADITDGHSMSGGCGLIVDDAGDDHYSCGVFGQGVAYWYGVGVLSDKSGDDEYDGLWYVQGATAHYAISLFKDEDGNDTYTAKQATSIGVGHDFSTSWHIDTGGNDTYNCFRIEENSEGKEVRKEGGLMLGCGNQNGIGIFVNVGGDDTYDAKSGRMYGGSYISGNTTPDTIRNEILCLGLFLDIGGHDTYGLEKCTEDDSWYEPSKTRPGIEVGVGMDANSDEAGGLVDFIW